MTKIKFEDYELRQLRASLVALTESYKREGLVDQSLKIISVEQILNNFHEQRGRIEVLSEKNGQLSRDVYDVDGNYCGSIGETAKLLLLGERQAAIWKKCEKLKEQIDSYNIAVLSTGLESLVCEKCEISLTEVLSEQFAKSPQKTIINCF